MEAILYMNTEIQFLASLVEDYIRNLPRWIEGDVKGLYLQGVEMGGFHLQWPGSTLTLYVMAELWRRKEDGSREVLAAPYGQTLKPVMRLDLIPLRRGRLKVRVRSFYEQADGLLMEMVKAMGQEFEVGSGKGGAPRLEERVDWPEKEELAREWVQRCQSGEKAEIAAQKLGYDVDTLRRWAKRVDQLRGKNRNKP